MPRRNHPTRIDLHGLPKPGETLDGKYRIDGLLGVGGMGIVFAATHLRLAQRVAIKMLLSEWVDDATVARRFAREGRASAAIRSEHIVRVLDVDESEGRPYLVLEYLEGRDFDALLAEHGALPIPYAIDLILEACEALAEAHVLGTIHRDLKPANLFLTHRADGSTCVKVLDFGISKVTATRTSICQGEGTLPLTVMGSPHYMSPEQMQSAKDVDARTDLWSLGAILHELLSGRPPFDGDTITALCAHVMTDPPPPLTRLRRDVPPALEGVVLRCLEKDRSRRYANVAELARALAGFGTEAAHASADRISRVVEGGIEGARPSPLGSSRAPTPNGLVSDPSYPSAIKRPIAGYALAAAALVALGAGATWKIATQARAIDAAVHERPAATALPAMAIPPVPSAPPSAAAAKPTATPTATPTSIASTTGALVAAPAPLATRPAPPAPTVAAIPARTHHARATHREPDPTPEPGPYDDPTTPAIATEPPRPAAAAAPTPSANVNANATPIDPNALFDQRK